MAIVVGIDEKAKMRVTCRNCASIVEYTKSDLRTWKTSSCGDIGSATGLTCPGCGADIVVCSD